MAESSTEGFGIHGPSFRSTAAMWAVELTPGA